MAKVILVKMPYPLGNDYLGDHAGVPTRHAYLSSILNLENIEHDILDLNLLSLEQFGIKKHNDCLRALSPGNTYGYLLKSFENKKKRLYLNWLNKKIRQAAGNADFIAINGDKSWLALNIMRIARRNNENIKIIVGGRRATDNPMGFRGQADFIIRGFADEVLPNVIKKPEQKISSYNTRINEVLTPDYSKINLKAYFKYFSFTGLISSLGCAKGCIYCNYSGRCNHIPRDIQTITEEIEEFRYKYKIRNFIFLDPCMNSNKKHFRILVRKMQELDVSWQGMITPSAFSDEDITPLAKSGCMFSTFGIESPVPRLLKKIGKNFNPIDAGRKIRKLGTLGVLTRASFMYDLPNEKISDFMSCIRFSRKYKLDYFALNRLRFPISTHLHDRSDLYVQNIMRDHQLIERIRSPAEIMSVILKSVAADFLNQKYLNKYRNNKRILEFTYKKWLWGKLRKN